MKKVYEITRGNTKGIEIVIKDGETSVEVDELYFTVKEDCCVEEVIFQKKLSEEIIYKDGAYYIVISPDDTSSLEYGRYVYDIKFIKDGIKKTIEKGIFLVSEEVTFACNEV